MHVLTLFLSLFCHLLLTNAYQAILYNASSPSLIYSPPTSWHPQGEIYGGGCPDWPISQLPDGTGTVVFSFKGVAVHVYGLYPPDAGPIFTIQVDNGVPARLGDNQAMSTTDTCDPLYSKRNMTYAEHKVTLTITAERPGNIRNFFFLGFVVAIPDPEDDWSSYVVNDGSNTTSAGSTTSQAQFDQSKKKIIIIAASCGAGAGILLALFLYCCCSCCKDDRNYHKSNKIQKRPKSTYSTAPAPGNGRRLTRSTYSTPAAALNNNINNNNNNSTSANPWSSSMSIRSAAPSIAPTTATSTTAFDTATFTRSSIYATPFEQPAKAKARHESLSSAHSSLYGQGIPPAGTAARYSMRPASSVISHQELPQYQPRLSYQPHSPSLLSSGFGIDSKPPPSSPTAITKTTAQADAKTSPLDSKAPSRLSSAAISYLLYPSPVASLEPPSPKPLNPSRTSSALHPNAAVITPPTAIESSEALE